MPNLFSTLQNSAHALRTLDRALTVTQNNVLNAQTPGFVKQRQTFEALAFDLQNGLLGGVEAGPVRNSRDSFAEAAVQRQTQDHGYQAARAQSLATIDPIFSTQSNGSIAATLQSLLSSFSNWSVSPNSTTARQDVLNQAQQFATATQRTYQQVRQEAVSIEQRIRTSVGEVNDLALQVREYNVGVRRTGQSDPAAEAQLHDALDRLSHLVPVTTLYQSDGSVTLLTAGHTPLVVGEDAFALTVETSTQGGDFPDGLPSIQVRDREGRDLAGALDTGALAGLLEVRNGFLPSIIGGGDHQGSLNQLASGIADRVNAILAAGETAGGQPGAALFGYDPAQPARVAATLNVVMNSSGDLAAIEPGPPPVANGAALALAGLASSSDPNDRIDGRLYLDFYAGIAAGVGSEALSAREGEQRQSSMMAWARSLRAEVSGVSLDEEAAELIVLQRSFEASARMVTVVDELTQTILNMVRR